jgi:uncharacterized protein (TIGR02444 family)
VRLWDWAGAAYARPGVEALCLALQDEHGQCVSWLLWALWAAAQGRLIDAAVLADAAAGANDLDSRVVQPIRQRRRRTIQPSLRAELKVLELNGEASLLAFLEERSPPPGGPPTDPRIALLAAATAWRADNIPAALLDRLADAFSIA